MTSCDEAEFESVVLDANGIASLVSRLRARVRVATAGTRVIVGLAGAPGSGKSTLAARLATHWNDTVSNDGMAAVVPMDGFHFTNELLAERGLRAIKGSEQTFDAAGYADLLEKARRGEQLFFPIYDRQLHDPVVREVPAQRLSAAHRLVLTEGNYLLLPNGEWPRARKCMDEVWFLATNVQTAREWIVARHMRGGRSEADAASHYDRVDRHNVMLVESHCNGATLKLQWP